MHYAIIGCIHGNRDALLAVLEDIERRGVDSVVCLGDVVGVGPDPIECLDIVREQCDMLIRGDQDEAVLTGSDEGVVAKTALVLDWTRTQIRGSRGAEERLAYLEKAVPFYESAGISFCHGSPRSPHEYVFPSDTQRDRRKLVRLFELGGKVCFHTHTHVPGVIVDKPLAWKSAQELDGYFHYRKGRRVLVNVGSVGQPRDGDPRACYLEVNKNELYWRRVEYDVDGVIGRLRANPVFAPDLALRLKKGR